MTKALSYHPYCCGEDTVLVGNEYVCVWCGRCDAQADWFKTGANYDRGICWGGLLETPVFVCRLPIRHEGICKLLPEGQ